MSFHALSELAEEARRTGEPMWRVVLRDDMAERDVSEEASLEAMRAMLRAMREADEGYDGALRSVSGLSGGDGALLESFRARENPLLSDYILNVMA